MIDTVNMEKELDIEHIKLNQLSSKDYEYLKTFCTIIQRKHYYFIRGNTQEDLIQIGVMKCISLIRGR